MIGKKEEAAIRDSYVYRGALAGCTGGVYAPSAGGGLEIFTGEKKLTFTFSDKKILTNRSDAETAVAEMYAELGPASPERHSDLLRKIKAYELALADSQIR